MMDDEYQRQLAQYNDEMSRWEREEYAPYKAQLAADEMGATSAQRFMAAGGPASMSDVAALNAANLADEEDASINTNPVGTAQQMLADLSNSGQEQTSYEATPTKQTIKRVRTAPASGKGVKGMTLEYESLTKGDLGAMQDFKPKFKETDSARAQLEDLARQYQLKLSAIKNKSRGLSADTFGAPTLEGPTLTKSRLTRKRFAEGGEVKDDEPRPTGISRVVDFIAQKLPPEAFPTAGRTLLESVQGKKEPITEGSFSRDELDVLRRLATQDKGSVSYEDYSRLAQQMRGEGQKNVDSTASLFSLGSPLGNVRNTLGRFTYARDPRGNVVIVDKYDFNPPDQSQTQEARTADYGVFGPYNLIREYAGQKLPPGKGRDVRINLGAPLKRAKGSPKEGEVAEPTPQELEAARRPAFVTPKSGLNRRQSITAGQANDAILQGISEMPYNLAGAFVDLPTMVMRPFGYSNPTPFLGSEYLKQGATALGIRPEPPKEPAARALYEMGQVGSSLVNPAAVARKVGPMVEKGVRAGATEVGRQLDRAIMDSAGPLAKAVPQAAKPLYAVRPEGSSLVVRQDKNPNWVGTLLETGVSDARAQLANMPHTTDRAALMEDFWSKKAANYFTKQFGTESDPVYRGIREQTIKSPALKDDFPDYILDQLTVGKTRAREGARPADDFVGPGAPEMRFFPKYPAAFDEMRSRYDRGTNIQGAVPVTNPANVMSPDFTYSQTREGLNLLEELRNKEIDKMIAQGTPASQATPLLEFLTRSVKVPETVVGPYGAKSLLTDYEAATGTRIGDPKFRGVPQPDALPQNLRTAMEKGEIVYSSGTPEAAVRKLFDTKSINEYLATVPERELKNLRFEDAVRGGAKISAKRLERETLAADIRAGKRVPDKFFSEGVSEPLLQFKEGPLAGFAWKRIKDADATVPEGAYVGHSVGGYAKGGAYGPEMHKQFVGGEMQVFTLRDNRNRPVTTIEVDMMGNGPRVKQIKGNGRATGNTAPEKYDAAVLDFFQNYLKPTQISESDQYLTPLLQSYKRELKHGPIPPELREELGLD